MACTSWECGKGHLTLSLLGSQWGPVPPGLSSSSSSFATAVSRTHYKCNAPLLVMQCPSQFSQGPFRVGLVMGRGIKSGSASWQVPWVSWWPLITHASLTCASGGFTILGWRCSPFLLPAPHLPAAAAPSSLRLEIIQRWGHPTCSRRMGAGERESRRNGNSHPCFGCRYGSWHPMLSCCICLLHPSKAGNGTAASCARQTPMQGTEGFRHAGSEGCRRTLV